MLRRRLQLPQFQFSLQTLFLIVVLVSVFMAGPGRRAQMQKVAVTAIEARGGHVEYDYEALGLTEPDAPGFLLRWLGRDYFANVVRVNLMANLRPVLPTLVWATDSDLVHMAALPAMEKLAIGGPGISDEGLMNLPRNAKLRRLDIWSSSVTSSGLACLRRFPNLEELGLNGSHQVNDAGLVHVARLSKLRVLSLKDTSVSIHGLALLRNLSRLEVLWLDDHLVCDESLVHIGRLSRLKELRVTEKSHVTDEGLRHLAGLTNLEALYLVVVDKGRGVSDAGLRHIGSMANLEELTIIASEVTDEWIGSLVGCRNLRRVEIGSRRITNDGLSRFVYVAGSLPRLESVSFSSPHIDDAGIAALQESLPQVSVSSWVAFR